MKKINKLAIVAALGLTLASVAQAETVIVPTSERMTTTRTVTVDRPTMRQPEMIGERVTVRTRTVQREIPTAPVVTGSTLAGRREFLSNNGVVVQSGSRQRAVYSDGGAIRSRVVRGTLPEGSVAGTAMEPSIAFGGTRISD